MYRFLICFVIIKAVTLDHFRGVTRQWGRTSLIAALMVLAVSASAASAATSYQIRGTVVCPSGQSVVGVWVNSSGGGSGWAGWTPYPGRPHVARYLRKFTTNLASNVSLNVGCGGTRARWSTSNRTPSIRIATGSILFMNTRCNTTTKTCAFSPLVSTPAAPATNPAFDATLGDPRHNGIGWGTYRAAEFWKTMTGRYPNWGGDAGDWDDNAKKLGWRIEGVPFPDSLAVWQPGTASKWGHVGYVSDVQVTNGVLQMKIYDRNWDTRGGDRNGIWVTPRADQRFIVAPPQVEASIR